MRDVQVVDSRTIVRIFISVDADKSDHLIPVLGDEHKLVSSHACQAIIPNTEAIPLDFSIEKVVAQHAPIGSSPAIGMEERDRLGVRPNRASVVQRRFLRRPERNVARSFQPLI